MTNARRPTSSPRFKKDAVEDGRLRPRCRNMPTSTGAATWRSGRNNIVLLWPIPTALHENMTSSTKPEGGYMTYRKKDQATVTGNMCRKIGKICTCGV